MFLHKTTHLPPLFPKKKISLSTVEIFKKIYFIPHFCKVLQWVRCAIFQINTEFPAPYSTPYTAQKINFSLKDFFSKCDQIRCKLVNWSHSLKKSLMENFIFCAVIFENIKNLCVIIFLNNY